MPSKAILHFVVIAVVFYLVGVAYPSVGSGVVAKIKSFV